MIDKEKYRTDGEFIGSSGIKLNKYYDFMRMFDGSSNRTDQHNDLNQLFYEIDEIYQITNTWTRLNLIGMETFGAIATAWGRNYAINPMFLLKPREHGNRKRLYGTLNKDNPVFLLDDVITTGGTIYEAIDYLLLHEDILVDEVVVLKSKLTEIDGYKIRVVGD